MRKYVLMLVMLISSITSFAIEENSNDSIHQIDEVSVTSFYRNDISTGSLISNASLAIQNFQQEPSHFFDKFPSIFSMSDNGTDYGYGYFRIRGLDQTRINCTVDGCPWNEAEDFGAYFANVPDLLSSMENVKVERGASSMYNGIAGIAGGLNFETIDVFKPHNSYASIGYGSFKTFENSAVYNMKPTDKWGLHIRGTHFQTDGFRDFSSNNSHSFTIKTAYKFNDKHSIDFFATTGYHRNGQGWLYNSMEELNKNRNANGNLKTEDDEFWTSFMKLQYKGWLSEHTLLSSALFFQTQRGSYRMDLDNYMHRMADPTWELGSTNILYDYALRYYMEGLNSAFKVIYDKFNVTAGFTAYNYYRHHFLGKKSENVNFDKSVYDGGDFYDNGGNKFDFTTFAIGNYNILRNLKVTANIQYRYVNFSYKDLIPNTKYSASTPGNYWNFINYGIGLEYKPLSNLKSYVRYNHVNREPTRSDMLGGNEYMTYDNGIPVLATTKNESANDIELGAEYISSNLKFNVNLYYMNFKNELVLNGNYGKNGLPEHDNAKSSKRYGIEVSEYWNVYDGFNFDNTFSFSKNKVSTETFGDNMNSILSPSVTWNTDLSWKKPRYGVGLNFNLRSKMYVDMTNEHSIPTAYTFNLYGNVKLSKNVELLAKVNNIFDRKNYCSGAVGANNETLYCPTAGTNVMGIVKFYF